MGQPLVLERVRVASHGLQGFRYAVVHPGVYHVIPWLPFESLLVASAATAKKPTKKRNTKRIKMSKWVVRP